MVDIPADVTTPASVAVGGTYNNTLEVAGDRDWIRVTLTAGQAYDIHLDGISLADPFLRIYDSAGNLIATNDDGGVGYNSLLAGFVASYTGAFYIGAGSFADSYSGTYQVGVTQAAPPSLSFLDSITWGTQINHTNITVYFAAAGEVFDGETSLGWNAYERQQFLAVAQQYANVTNLSFTVVNNPAAADLHLVTNTSSAYLGHFNPPGTTNAGVGVFSQIGDGWDESLPGTGGLEQGGYGFVTMLHELGHGLGMAHPHDNGGTSTIWQGVTGAFDSFGVFDLNQGIYTTMSYNDGWQLQPGGVNTANEYGWQGTLMAFDIALMQQLYGADMTFHAGNDTYVIPNSNASGTFFTSIWDAGGIDQMVYNGARAVSIDLRAATLGYNAGAGGYISYAAGIYGGFTIAHNVVIENARGGSGNDHITGNALRNTLNGRGGADTINGGAGSDHILGGNGVDHLLGGAGIDFLTGGAGRDIMNGGAGIDFLTGGAGRDIMNGGAGADDFIYSAAGQSGTSGATRDTINQFVSGVDDINLRPMDARTGGGANDVFTFIGTAAFGHHQGELRWQNSTAGVTVSADRNGDGVADFQILLAGIHQVTAADFFL